MGAAGVAGGAQRHDPAGAAPVGRVVDVAVHGQRGQYEAVRGPTAALLRRIAVTAGGDLRWVEQIGVFGEDARQRVLRAGAVQGAPLPGVHVVAEPLAQIGDSAL